MPQQSCSHCGRPLAADSTSLICPECESVAEATLINQDDGTNPNLAATVTKQVDSEQTDCSVHVDDSLLDGMRDDGSDPFAPSKVRRFGDYEIERELARGGMGVVFRARQVSLNRPVALKMILASQLASDDLIQRFYIEAEAAAKLDHSGIVPIYEVGEHDGQHFFSMGLVEGGSLAELVKEGPLPPRRAAELVRAIADAVQYAHARNIVHRDLKPANILLDGDGQPKVTDFGLAKNVEGSSGLTMSGQILGTPSYMPPEQAAGKMQEIGPLADVYSLGAILYCLLVGRPPFQGSGVLETLKQVQETEPVPPRQLNENVDLDLETICLKCLQKEPERRYASAAELADELRRFLDGRPITARPIGHTERAAKWIRRNKGLSIGLAAALLALIGGGIGVGVGISKSEKQRIEAELRKQAETERDLARSAREAERTARIEVEETRDLLARIEYGRSMQLAHQRWRDGDVNAALALLEDTPSQLRGWEWRYVNRLCHSELLTIQEDSKDFLSVGFSPDGARIVTGGWYDTVVRIWRADTGEELLQLNGHTGPVNSVCYNSDGTRILTSSDDATFRIWDADTGHPLKVFDTHTEQPVFARSWSPDESRIVTSDPNGLIRIRDAATGEQLVELKGHRGAVRTALYSPDGSRIATSGNGDGTARIWNALTGKPIGPPLKHVPYITSVSFSRDGSRLATSGGVITRIWDLASHKTILVLKGHSDTVRCVKYSPDGNRIATAGSDHTARIWNAKTGEELFRLVGHTDRIGSVAFSPARSTIATSSRDGTVKLWDLRHSPEYSQLPVNGLNGSSTIKCVTFSPDGSRVAATVNGGTPRSRIRVWNVATGQLLRESVVHPRKPARTVSFSTDGKQLLVSCDDGTARILDVASGELVRKFAGHSLYLWSAVYSRNGHRVVTASEDGTVRLWDAFNGEGLLTITGPGPFAFADISPDASRLVTGGREDHIARIWDVHTGRELIALDPHSDEPIWQARFNPDGSKIVTVGGDGTARVWDTQTGAEQHILRGHSRRVVSGAFSPDGTRIVTTSYDSTVKVWDANSGAELLTLKGHRNVVWSAAFSPDGSEIVSGGSDGTVKIWSVRDKSTTTETTARKQN